MADRPTFQGHHVIEQEAFRRSALLQALSDQQLFDLHGARNILNLPADRALAAELGVSPHTGGPLNEYNRGLLLQLERLERSVDGQAALEGDPAAARRVAARVDALADTLKVGLLNTDLVSNTPEGMTSAQASERVRAFFGDIDGFQQRYADQIADLGRMTEAESRWAGVTRSEANVRTTLDAIEQPGKSTLSPRWGGHESLGTAITDANQAGRLPVSPELEARLRTTFPLQSPDTFLRTAAPLPADLTPETRGLSPRGATVARVAGAAGVAALAYDFVDTGHRVVQLRGQGNEAGADSARDHFVGRNAGGLLGGFLLGAGYGAVSGSWTGPGTIVTSLAGGVGGAYLGDRWAEQRDIDRVYTQTDRSGNTWSRDPENPQAQWTRAVGVPTPDGRQQETRLVAAGRLTDELNYRAANDSYSLGLANPPRPQNPYRLDATGETHPPRAPFEASRAYVRDASSGDWSMEVREYVDGRVPITRHHPVAPERATELDQRSQTIIAQNASNTPAAIAARYQVAFNQFQWAEFGAQEPVPGAITQALAQTEVLQAHDGHTYTRGADGTWSRPGMIYGSHVAEGNLRDELDNTRRSLLEGLRDMDAVAEEARLNPTPTQSDLRSQVAGAYARAGQQPDDGLIDAATAAVTRRHEDDGITASRVPFFLRVRADGAIETVAGEDDRRMDVRSVATPEEIQAAQSRQATPEEPRQDGQALPPMQAQGTAGSPGTWDQSATGQYVGGYMAALQRGDEAEAGRLTEAFTQTTQFQDWMESGRQSLREAEQQRQAQSQGQEQQASSGIAH